LPVLSKLLDNLNLIVVNTRIKGNLVHNRHLRGKDDVCILESTGEETTRQLNSERLKPAGSEFPLTIHTLLAGIVEEGSTLPEKILVDDVQQREKIGRVIEDRCTRHKPCVLHAANVSLCLFVVECDTILILDSIT